MDLNSVDMNWWWATTEFWTVTRVFVVAVNSGLAIIVKNLRVAARITTVSKISSGTNRPGNCEERWSCEKNSSEAHFGDD
jgi:hypothetical protein